jgi:predicted ATPase/class 3 adenylate cyclase
MASMRTLPTGTVTFLFTDIEGSTQLLTDLGDRFPAVLGKHHELIRAALASEGGIEVSTDGDAFFAVFTDAPSSVRAALAAQRTIAPTPWPDGRQVRVRMGIHTGLGTLLGDNYVGIDVHRAARIAAAGHGGQVLVSDSARALLGSGLPPDVALRDLGEHRLKDLPSAEHVFQLLAEGLASDFPPLRSLDARRGNLPDRLTSFVGRDAEIEQLSELLLRARLVTLTGPGGAGKTRLSIEAARSVRDRFRDGVWFVPLEAVQDPDLVLPAVAAALAVKERADRTSADALAEHLSDHDALLVLDNMEQVVAAGSRFAHLLAAAPRVRLLVSSREVLRVTGEQEFPVPPLPADPAVELFLQRARQVRPDFEPGPEDLETIRHICERLDGLPLAIELAAARVRVLSPGQILDRLGDRLKLLAGGDRDRTDRQRTLRGAIEWSHALLSPAEQRFFRRFGVFAARPDLDAIEAVIDPDGDADPLDLLTSLVEKSLIRRVEEGEARFAMLETIREYASERLADAGEEDELRERHALHFAQVAERAGPELLGATPMRFLDTLEADRDEFRALTRWSLQADRPEIGVRACAAIWRLWQQRGPLAEGRARLAELLAHPALERDPVSRAKALSALGGVAYWQADLALTREVYEEALRINRDIGDSSAIAGSLYDLSFPVAIGGDASAASALQEEALALYEAAGDEERTVMVRESMGVSAMVANDLVRAREIEEAVIAAYRRLHMRFKVSDGLTVLTAIYVRLGDAAAASRALSEAIAISRPIGDRSAWATHIQMGALVSLAEDDAESAAILCGAFEELQRGSGPYLTPALGLGLRDPILVVQEQLDAETYRRLSNEGRARPVDEVLRDLELRAPRSVEDASQG